MDAETQLGAGQYLRLVERQGWEYAEHLCSSTIACVAALTSDLELLLVEQWRGPISTVAVELPAGLVERDETGARAAARELLEETGYAGDPPRLLARSALSAGLSSCRMEFYEIMNATCVDKGGGSEVESLTTHTVALSAVRDYFASFPHDEKCFDWRILAAANLLQHHVAI